MFVFIFILSPSESSYKSYIGYLASNPLQGSWIVSTNGIDGTRIRANYGRARETAAAYEARAVRRRMERFVGDDMGAGTRVVATRVGRCGVADSMLSRRKLPRAR